MERLRLASLATTETSTPCCRCSAGDRSWDRIGGDPYCPNCQEALIVGDAAPLVLRTEKKRCAVCNRMGTVPFVTYPLNVEAAVEIDLCAEHLRSIISRRLMPYAYHQLRRQLQGHRLAPDDVFLLHGEFYDRNGRALRPAIESDYLG